MLALYTPDPEPEHDELAERVDEILKKISEQGRAGLTDEELGVLEQASARYRARKK